MKLFKKLLNCLKAVTITIIGLIPLIFSIGLDLTYSGRITFPFLMCLIKLLKSILIPIGFNYQNLRKNILGSLGITFTTLSLLLTMGINLSNRFEIKVFGIPRCELKVSFLHKIYNRLRILIYIFPFLMLVCVNLELCTTGYIILAYNMLFLIMEYVFIVRSYKHEKDINNTVNKLISIYELKDNAVTNEYMQYQAWLEAVRRGIEEADEWQRAELLCEHFINQMIKYNYEYDKCYIGCYFFFDIIFCHGNQNEVNNSSLRCLKQYISKLYDKNTETWSEIIFCALVKASFKYWNESQIADFLKWFLDFPSRSNGGNRTKLEYIQTKQLIQINIIIIMIEEWRTHQRYYDNMLNTSLKTLWSIGNLSDRDTTLYRELCEIIQNTEEHIRYKNDKTMCSYQNICEDYRKNRGISFIGNTIRERNEE